MTMDNTEIINNYRAAADPKRQIDVLAELNACKREDIIRILTENGVKVDKRWFTNPRKASQERAAAKAQQETMDAASAQQDKPEPPAKDSSGGPEPERYTKTLTLTRTEYFALRKYMEETLTGYIHDKTERANANLGELYAITGVWAKVTGGRT